MNHPAIIDRLSLNADVMRAMLEDVSGEQARWRPAPGQWSILEVVNHLYDEERDDFRQRLRLTLEDPAAEWPPIDPERWAVERRYNERDLDDSVRRFLDEREESVVWLMSLESPDWQAAHVHPKAGALSAETILANWLAHDLLHLRQVVRLQYRYLATQIDPSQLRYAGDW